MKIKYKRILFFILLIGWMAVIYRFSANPATVSDGQSLGLGKRVLDLFKPILPVMSEEQEVYIISKMNLPIRKAAHITEFAILGCFSWLFVNTYEMKRHKSVVFSVILGVIYATSDEIHQLFVPGRAGMLMDVVIDTIGVLVGVAFIMYIYKSLAK